MSVDHSVRNTRDPRAEIDVLGREVYDEGYERFLMTPRRSLGGETPSAHIERGEFDAVLSVLAKALNGDFA